MEIANNLESSVNAGFNSLNSQDGRSNLNGDDFLELMLVQLTNQDPLEPVSDTEFIAQMANFSSLEQMSQLNDSFGDFSRQQLDLAAQNYLGRGVTIDKGFGVSIDGLVTAVRSELNPEGQLDTKLTVDGNEYDLSQVREVRLAKEEAS